MPNTDTATATAIPASVVVSTLVDGDTVSRDNLFKEASPGATPKLTLALLLDYLVGIVRPVTSRRGALAANETLTLGFYEYWYLAPSGASRIVYLPAGQYDGQRIKVCGRYRNPTYALAFQYASYEAVNFPSGSGTDFPIATLVWDATGYATGGTPTWVSAGDQAGGATLP